MIEINVELEKKEIRKIKEKKKIKPLRIIISILIFFSIIGVAGWFGYQQYQKYAAYNEAKVQLEIKNKIAQGLTVPDSNTEDPLAQNYKEIYSTLPYSQTKWKVLNSVLYNFEFTYPTNTSALIKNDDGTQIWLARRDGYMFRITISDATPKETAQDFYSQMGNKNSYSATPTKFADQKALFLQLIDTTLSITGNQYIIVYKGRVYILWYETFPTGQFPDDVRRIQDILKSFEFTNT